MEKICSNALDPRKAREITLQLLYSFDLEEFNEQNLKALIMEQHKITAKKFSLILERTKKIIEELEMLDGLIQKYSIGYSLHSISKMEKNILRLSFFELIKEKDKTPPKVVFAESLRLCRKFSLLEATSFVNAILDAFYKQELSSQ